MRQKTIFLPFYIFISGSNRYVQDQLTGRHIYTEEWRAVLPDLLKRYRHFNLLIIIWVFFLWRQMEKRFGYELPLVIPTAPNCVIKLMKRIGDIHKGSNAFSFRFPFFITCGWEDKNIFTREINTKQSSFSLPQHKVKGFITLPQSLVYMICCLATRIRETGLTDPGPELPKLWAKARYYLLSLVIC